MRRRNQHRRRPLRLASCCAGLSLLASALPSLAEPMTPTIADNSAIVRGGVGAAAAEFASVANGASGVDLTVTQNSARVVIDWASFNIDAADAVAFDQTASNWIAVNRVTGGAVTPSMINGALSATGHVWILDPSGVMFGAGATVDVGGLLATSSNIDPATFVAADPATDTFTFTADGDGAVTNAATLHAAGLVALVAPVVTNSGTLQSDNGEVLLGGAQAFRIRFAEATRTPSGGGADYQELLVTDFIIDTGVTLDPTPGSETVAVTQTAAGRSEAGRVIMSAASTGGGAFLNLDGIVEASDVGTSSGDVFLLGGADIVSGSVGTTGTETVRTADLGITAPGALRVQASAIIVGDGTPGISVGSATLAAITGDVTVNEALTATGAISVTAANGNVDVAALSAGTSVMVSGQDIDLTGKVTAGTAASLTATAGDISSATALEVEGASVTLTGPVNAATSATITATTGDATIGDAVTATSSAISVTAANGNVDVAALSAGTSVTVSGQDIDLAGKVTAGTAASLTATVGDISSATALEVEGASVTLTGPVNAATSATITASTGDATINNAVTATSGAISITAASGNVAVVALTAGTSVAVAAQDIDLAGKVIAGTLASLTATVGDISSAALIDIQGAAITLTGMVNAGTNVLLSALAGDATVAGKITVSSGDVTVNAVNGTITVGDIATSGAVRLVGGALDIVGTVVAQGTAFLQALTGNVTVHESVTAVGGSLILDAANGDAVLNRLAALDDISVNVADLDLSGSISAGDLFELTSGRTGETIVLGGDGTTGGVTLRRTAGLTLDESELTRISAGRFDIDAGANDVLLRDAGFTAATLDTLRIGTDQSSRIFATGTVTGLSSLQLGYISSELDRRPELILVSGQLGLDSLTGRLGLLRLESADDIIIGTEAFLALWESQSLALNLLAAPPLSVLGATAGHVFVATDKLQLVAPGSVVQLNTGTGVDGAGLVIGAPTTGEGVLFPSETGPEEAFLFGTIIRADGTRVSSFEAGLVDNILFPGDSGTSAAALTQSGDYRWNLCLIGDPVSCSSDFLRDAERNGRFINNDPSGIGSVIPLVFETGEGEENDQEEDLGGVAASGNEALWDAGAR